MRLPCWFPAVPRPFNPAYRPVWDAMSHAERQMSCLIDMVICLFAIAIITGLQGLFG
jgi:hypothetical protein